MPGMRETASFPYVFSHLVTRVRESAGASVDGYRRKSRNLLRRNGFKSLPIGTPSTGRITTRTPSISGSPLRYGPEASCCSTTPRCTRRRPCPPSLPVSLTMAIPSSLSLSSSSPCPTPSTTRGDSLRRKLRPKKRLKNVEIPIFSRLPCYILDNSSYTTLKTMQVPMIR